jgi:dolichyl-phosphate-mannose-protein mannosyltransferase
VSLTTNTSETAGFLASPLDGASVRFRLALAGILGVVLIAIVGIIYSTDLDRVPPHLAHDEVVIEVNARTIAKTGVDTDGNKVPTLFGDSAFGMSGGEPITIYWTALVIKTLWQDEFAIRRASVLIGLLNIGLMFLAARRYFDSVSAGAVAALLLAMTPVHFFYSRVGVEVVYLLPFVLVWFLLLTSDRQLFAHSRIWPIGVAAFVLGLSVYAYKSALILAPTYLGLTIALVTWRALAMDVPTRRVCLMVAATLGGFVVAVMPYAFDVMSHADRIARFSRAYGVGDPKLTLLQNLRDFARYQSLGTRIGIYFDSFNPTHLFFFGAGGWTDSTRQAGLFLVGAAIPIGVGLYVSLGPHRSFSRLFVVAGFLLAPISNVILNEVTLRRMIPIAVFGVLLATEGWRFISARWRLGPLIAASLALVTLVHFQLYYRDYLTDYPLNSYRAWELNLGEALQRLAERHEQRGRQDLPVIFVRNQFINDYARLYLPESDLIQRAEHRKPSRGLPARTEDARLILRQLLLDEREEVADACPSWHISAVVREPHGAPSFVVCERE